MKDEMEHVCGFQSCWKWNLNKRKSVFCSEKAFHSEVVTRRYKNTKRIVEVFKVGVNVVTGLFVKHI